MMKAFILRIAPSEIDRVSEALETDHIIIGWANATGLLNSSLSWEQFRERVRTPYYLNEPTLRRAGAAAGNMWRFIREMEIGDLVVVPSGASFYVAEIIGEAIFANNKQDEDSAYRRSVKWLNNKKPILRSHAKAALISRMKIQNTSALATDLLPEIQDCLELASAGVIPTFQGDLQARLVKGTLEELRSGRLDSFGFENLIKNLLLNLGAKDANVIARSKDKGADIVATFLVADTFPLIVAVQAKHWQPDPPVGRAVVDQLELGITAEGADLGMIVTSGTFDESAIKGAEDYYERTGKKVELVDGEQFAKMLIEYGLGATPA